MVHGCTPKHIFSAGSRFALHPYDYMRPSTFIWRRDTRPSTCYGAGVTGRLAALTRVGTIVTDLPPTMCTANGDTQH
jgi:hypothetical protein